ncbi:MAG: TOBE domain-containing protein, partial [Candidatus Poribacteria bacterium]|nr:TOBE domain-containing protein [Candidatus Poribacteria bacterium]
SGDSVTLGIRPEDIHIGENGNNRVDTQVELVEPLGNHALLYLRTEKSSFVAQSDLIDMPQHNALVTVNFNMDKAHLFHPETGESLTAF